MEAAHGEYHSELHARMATMVSSITEVAWLSLEPQSGSHVDFYEAAVSERLEEAYQGLVSAEPGTAIPVNCALGETFVVPGAVVSMVRHDPTPKEARTAYHLFQSTSSGGHRSVLRCEVARLASSADGELHDGRALRDVELKVQSTAAGEWEFVDGGISERPDRELIQHAFRAAVPQHVVILSVPVIRAPSGDAPVTVS